MTPDQVPDEIVARPVIARTTQQARTQFRPQELW